MNTSTLQNAFGNVMQTNYATKSATAVGTEFTTRCGQISPSSCQTFDQSLQTAIDGESTADSTNASPTVGQISVPNETLAQLAKSSRNWSFRVPDADLIQMRAYHNRTLPQEIIDEAKARLANDSRLGDCRFALGMDRLPILPENQKLIDQIREEFRAQVAADPDGFVDSGPSWHLMLAIMKEGWKRPMTLADARREADIATAMARLAPAISDEQDARNVTMASQRTAGEIPDVWKQRWQQENLPMPEIKLGDFPRSMWLDLAQAAGISDSEFLSKAREFASKSSGNAYLKAIEEFISQRYSSSKTNAA